MSDDSTPRLRLGLTVPPGDLCDTGRCWHANRDRSFTYKDKRAGAVGVSALELRGKPNAAADIRLEASGAGLIGSALPLTTPVKAQLVNLETRSCWEASYARARRSGDEVFQATSD